MTPKQALQDLIAGNKRFCSNNQIKRDSLVALSQRAAQQGQAPKAVILACMDSRSVPELVFDQSIGDLFILRVAGNVVNNDILASMEFATQHVGAKVIVIMGHTQCGAIQAACAGMTGGHLDSLVRTINPAVTAVQKQILDKQLDCDDDTITKKIALRHVHNMVNRIVKESIIIRELLTDEHIEIVGAIHDLVSGVVTLEQPPE